MDYAPSHLYGHTVVKVLSFLLILPNALYERRFRANGSHNRQLPNSPRTDLGVGGGLGDCPVDHNLASGLIPLREEADVSWYPVTVMIVFPPKDPSQVLLLCEYHGVRRDY
jgi:hypothetical protein